MVKHQNRRLGVERLDRREVMSATIFESEPNNTKATADVVQLDATDNAAQVSGAIINRKDEDFFRYQPTADGTLSLNLNDGPTLSAKISVEDAAGRKLFESEPRNGVANGSFPVTAGQDVFIRMRSQNSSIGSYTLQLSLGTVVTPPATPPTAPSGTPATVLAELEGNNSKATANKVDLGASLRIQGASSKSDDDFFALRATTTGTVQIATTSGSVKFSIEDARGNKVFESEPNNGVLSGSFTAIAGTTYYLRIRGTNAALSPYLVDLALS